MGVRTYYVIFHTVDYDGYNTYIDYIGTNYEAAANRYRWLYNFLKEHHYLNIDVAEERIQKYYDEPNKQTLDRNGIICSSMSDDEMWLSLVIKSIKTNGFDKYEGNNIEERYKLEFPNSKY